MMNTNAASDDSERDSFGELNSFQDFDNPENASASSGQGALDDTTPAALPTSASIFAAVSRKSATESSANSASSIIKILLFLSFTRRCGLREKSGK